MAQVIIDIITVISGAVSLVGFIEQNVPNKDNQGNSIVRVAAGISSQGLKGGGTAPVIWAYNEQYQMIGQYIDDSQTIQSGGFLDLNVNQNVGVNGAGKGQQATYIQVVASAPICIPYISQTWADGTNRGWLGDMATACGATHGMSTVIVGDSGHTPDCLWLAPQPNPQNVPAGVQIHMQDFASLNNNYDKDPKHYCTWPKMEYRPNVKTAEISTFWDMTGHEAEQFAFTTVTDGVLNALNLPPESITIPPDAKKKTGRKRRSNRPMKRGVVEVLEHEERLRGEEVEKAAAVAATASLDFEGQLIITDYKRHTISNRCFDPLFLGPDVASLVESKFCDMKTRTVYQFCTQGEESGEEECFDVEALVLKKKGKPLKRSTYTHVKRWEMETNGEGA